MASKHRPTLQPTKEQDRLLKVLARSATPKGLKNTVAEMFPNASLQERIDLEQMYKGLSRDGMGAFDFLGAKLSLLLAIFGIIIMTIGFMGGYYLSFYDSSLGFFEMPSVPWRIWITGAIMTISGFSLFRFLVKGHNPKGKDISRNLDKTFFKDNAIMLFIGLAILGLASWIIIAFFMLLNCFLGAEWSANTISFIVIALIYLGFATLYISVDEP